MILYLLPAAVVPVRSMAWSVAEGRGRCTQQTIAWSDGLPADHAAAAAPSSPRFISSRVLTQQAIAWSAGCLAVHGMVCCLSRRPCHGPFPCHHPHRNGSLAVFHPQPRGGCPICHQDASPEPKDAAAGGPRALIIHLYIIYDIIILYLLVFLLLSGRGAGGGAQGRAARELLVSIIQQCIIYI
jgi:hypothetical protein